MMHGGFRGRDVLGTVPVGDTFLFASRWLARTKSDLACRFFVGQVGVPEGGRVGSVIPGARRIQLSGGAYSDDASCPLKMQ